MSNEPLKLSIVRGSNLKSKNSDSSPDTYVKILIFEGQYIAKFQTRVIKKSQHPIWNDSYDILVDRVHPIRIEVYGKRSFRKDDNIGMCAIEWWLDSGLMENGKTIIEAELKTLDLDPGQSAKPGKITIMLQIPNFKKEPGIVAPKKDDPLTTIAKSVKIATKPVDDKKKKIGKADNNVSDDSNNDDDDGMDISEAYSGDQVSFNVWYEGKNESQTISVSIKSTFGDILRMAIITAGITEDTNSYRLYGSPPAYRNKYYGNLPYESKDKIWKALRSRLINFGDVLLLKKFNSGEKPYLRSKGKGVYEVVSGRDFFLNIEYWRNNTECKDVSTLTVSMGQQLSEIVDKICTSQGDDPSNYRLYRVGLSSETGGRRTLVELDQKATMDQVYMVEGDTLAIRPPLPFKTFQEKFRQENGFEKTLFSLISHCYYNPIHKVWKKVGEESPLPGIATRLKLQFDETGLIEEEAQKHSLYGCESILAELANRIANTGGNEYYARETFADREFYKQWVEEQRKEVLELMETCVTELKDFCCEIEVNVVKGTNLLSADLNGLSDPYVVLAYKSQRKSTRVINFTLNPVWNESLLLRSISFDTQIGITCYDHDFDDSDDFLGATHFNIREHPEILDGRPHEYTLNLENKEKQGSLTLEITCHYPYGKYFAFVRDFDFAKPPASDKDKPINIPYADYYNELFIASGELESMNEVPPWYIREFSTRFCVSEGYCSLLKLQSLMMFGVPYSNTIRNYALSLVRFNSPPNKAESHAFAGCLRSFLDQVGEKYFIDIFTNAKTEKEITLLPQVFHELVDLAYETEGQLRGVMKEKLPDVASIITSGFGKGGKKFTDIMGTNANFIRIYDAFKYKDVVKADYTRTIKTIVDCIKGMPAEDLRQKLQVATGDFIGASISQDITKYCDTVSKEIRVADMEMLDKLKENVDETIAELSKIWKDFFETNGITVNGEQFNALITLWLRITSKYLEIWIKETTEEDSINMLKAARLEKLVSKSFDKIHSTLSNMMAHLESAVITDSKLWLQIGEIFMTNIKDYIIYEKEHGESCLKNLGSREEKLLKSMCLHMNNLIPSIDFIGEIHKRVVDNISAVNEKKGGKDTNLDSINSTLGISFDGITKECNTALDSLIEMISKDCTNEIMGDFIKNHEGAFEKALGIYTGLFTKLGDYATEALLKRIKLVFGNTFINDFVHNVKPIMLLTVNSAYLHILLTGNLSNFKLVVKEKATPDSVLGKKEADIFRNNINLVPEYLKFNNQVMEFFGKEVDIEKLKENPNYTLITHYINLYDANQETLISLHMKRAAKEPFSLEEEELYGGVDTESILTLIQCFDINGYKWSDAYLEELNGSDTSKKIRDILDLPPDEFVLNSFGMPTSIVLTTKSVCYVPLISSNSQYVALNKISEVSASKTLTGTKLHIKIRNNSNSTEEYTFYSSSFYSDKIQEYIIKQAKDVGNPYLSSDDNN